MLSIFGDPTALITETGLLNKSSRFVIVEGKTDRQAIWRHVKRLGLSLRCLDGKANVLKFAKSARERGIDNVIAIVDSNGWSVLGMPAEYSELNGGVLAVTQYRDLEMDILGVTGIEGILAECLDTTRVDLAEASLGINVAESILHNAARIGALRVVNEAHSLGGKVNTLAYRLSQDPFEDCSIAMLVELAGLTPEVRNFAIERSLTYLDTHSPQTLACGHDVSALISRASGGTFGGGRAVSSKDVERMIRVAAGREVFDRTSIGVALEQFALAPS